MSPPHIRVSLRHEAKDHKRGTRHRQWRDSEGGDTRGGTEQLRKRNKESEVECNDFKVNSKKSLYYPFLVYFLQCLPHC